MLLAQRSLHSLLQLFQMTATAVVIAGTNFTNMPSVEAINTTGAIVAADSITYTSAASLTATFTLPVDGTYFVRVENPDGVAVRTSSADLTVSDAPAWVTTAGTLGTLSGSAAISTINFNVATDATSFAVTTGAVTAGLTFYNWSRNCYNNRNTNGSLSCGNRFVYGYSNRCRRTNSR